MEPNAAGGDPPLLPRVACDGRARSLGHPVRGPASALRSSAAAGVLERLRATGEIEDDPGRRRVRAREAELGAPHDVRYRRRIAGPAHGSAAIEVPLDDGAVLSARCG